MSTSPGGRSPGTSVRTPASTVSPARSTTNAVKVLPGPGAAGETAGTGAWSDRAGGGVALMAGYRTDSMGAEHATDTGAGRGDPADPAFGWWPSPWPASMVAAGKVGRSGLQAEGADVYWIESRPDDGGRQVVVGVAGGQPPVDVSPAGVSVGSRVHEYGGGAATVDGGALFYVNQDDQRWYLVPVNGSSASRADSPAPSAPASLTPPPPADGSSRRYADGRLAGSGQWLVSVEERIGAGRTGHRLVAVGVHEPAVVPVVEEGDFV